MQLDDKVDSLPGSLAGGLEKLRPEQQQVGGGIEYASGSPDELIDAANTVDWATHSLVTAGMTPQDLDPSFADIVGAEFRQNNVVASALTSNTLSEALTAQDDSKPLTHADIIQKVEAANLQPYFDYFKGARTENEFDAIHADLERELQDKRIQEAAGWTGTAVGIGAAIADVPSLLPGSIAVKGLSKAPAAMRAAIEFGLGGAAFAGASEAGLQASQVTRTKEQAIENIGSATILGGVLGASVHAIIGPAGDKVIERLDDTRTDAANGYPKARAAGAQTAGDIYDQATARGLHDDDRLFNGGAFTSLEKLGDIPVIGQYLRNPRIDSERSPSSAVRDTIERLSDTASITKRNAQGVASKDSAQALIGKYQGQLAQAHKEIDDLYTANKAAYPKGRDQFNTAVALALAQGDKSADPTVTKAAAIFRERVYEPVRKALVDNKIFLDAPELKNAESYFPVIYDSEAIKAQKDDFINVHTEAFRVDLHDQARQALVAKGIKESDVEDAKIKNFGVNRQAPKVDENGQPVLNPKTGKQVLETQTGTPGTVREARDQLNKEAQRQLSQTANDKSAALETFDKGQDAPLPDFKDTFEARDKIKDERINIEGVRDDKLKDLAAELSRKEDEIDSIRDRAVIDGNMTREAKKVANAQREVALTRARAAADKEARSVKFEAKQQLKKLDEKLRKTRENVIKHFDELEKEIRTTRDEQIAEAVNRGRDEILKARGVDLPEGHANILKRFTKGGTFNADAIEKEAIARAEALYRSVTGQERYTLSHEVNHNNVSGYAKVRKNPEYHADLIRKGWAVADAMDAAEKYTKTAGTDAALGTIFKKPIPKVDEAGNVVKDANGKVEMEMVGDPKLDGKGGVLERIKKDWNENIIANATVPKKVQDKLAKKFKGDAQGLEEALNKARRDAENKLLRQRDRDVSNIETLLAFARGTSLSQTPKALHQAAEYFGIFNFVTKMGGTVLSSLGDPINIALSQGFGNAAKYGLVPLFKEFREAYLNANGDLRRLSRLAGANMEMEHGARIAAMGDLGNVYSSRDAMARPRRIAETFGKLSGITYWNSFLKQISYNTSQARMIMNAVTGFENLSAGERAWMASLGVDADRAAKFKEQFELQAQKTEATIPVAKWDEWEDKAAGEAFRQAVYRESFNNVIAPTMSDRIALSASPIGRMVLQFRNFMIANQMRLIGRNIQLASLDRQRAANAYTGLFGLVLASAMIDFTKRFFANTDVTGTSLHDDGEWQRYVDDWDTHPAQQLYNALDRSSVFGVLFEGSNILDKLGLPSIQGGARMVTGEDSSRGTSRTKDVSVLGSAFGPTVGLLDDLAAVGKIGTSEAGSMLRHFTGSDNDFDSPYEFTRGDWKRVQRLIPGNTIPWLRPVLNEGQRHVGNALDWPSQ